MRPDVRDPRFLLLLGATLMLGLTFVAPTFGVTRFGVDVLVAVDITGSMKTRDYASNGRPVSRLEFAKTALRGLLADLPCPSRVGVAIFAERQPFLLFEPIDVCANFAPVDAAIQALDWRMAWEGDSRISSGLFRAFDMARSLNADLLFITDGHEAPPLPASGGAVFEGRRGEVRGLIAGAGGYELSPIPKYDDYGREIGFYGAGDVPHESRFGLPPTGADQREGYNARNAPFGSAVAVGTEHLSSVREPYLKGLAETTGLAYVHLDGSAGLATALKDAATPRSRAAPLDLRPLFGGAALACLVALYIAVPLREWASGRKASGALTISNIFRRRK